MGHYLDFAASAPLRPCAREAWLAAAAPGNPAGVHRAARLARATLDAAREKVAQCLGASEAEVIWTSGGTEADNLALAGLYHARQSVKTRPYVLVSAVEHMAVLGAARLLEQRAGARVVEIPVDQQGVVDLAVLADLLAQYGESTALVSVMGANNENGAIQPLAPIVALAATYGLPCHADMVQWAGHRSFDFAASGLAAASLSGHKLGGPVGTGVLLLAADQTIRPITGGGGQERAIRSGTQDSRGAAAFAAALSACHTNSLALAEPVQPAGPLPAPPVSALPAPTAPASAPPATASGQPSLTGQTNALEAEATRLEQLLKPLDQLVNASDGRLRLRSPAEPAQRLPGLRLLTVPDSRADDLAFLFDQAGLAVSTGAACHSGVAGPSHVLLAIGCNKTEAAAGVRISLGWSSTADDVTALVAALPAVLAQARQANQ